MTTTIQIFWWSFLVGALLITLVDVFLLVRVVYLARGIHVLAGATVVAAGGIARNTTAGEGLGRTLALIGTLVKQTAAVDPLTARVVKRLTERGS